MKLVSTLLLAGIVFGLCYLIDKGFQKLFRNRKQHQSGKSVRLNRNFGITAVLLCFIGAVSVITSGFQPGVLLFGGAAVLLGGLVVCLYLLQFGIYYDEEGILVTTLGKPSVTYAYRDILGQRLYVVTGKSIVVELHMANGKTVAVQTNMEGAYGFLDEAFSRWCSQTGRDPDTCDFHDPANHLWFPKTED